MQAKDAPRLAQEAYDKFKSLADDSVQMRLLIAYVRLVGDLRQQEVDITQVDAVINECLTASLGEIQDALGIDCGPSGQT